MHKIFRDSISEFAVSSALLDEEAFERAMKNDSWDLQRGDGKPGFSQIWGKDKEIISYHRYGSVNGERPLVWYRQFHRAFPQYVELDEEFRLYHDLAEDKSRGVLLTFDRSGREIEVARITPDLVTVDIKYIRQFQAGIGSHLAIYFVSTRHSNTPLVEFSKEEKKVSFRDDLVRWSRYIGKNDSFIEYETFSRLIGKVILAPSPKQFAGIWPFEVDESQKQVSFIVGIDEHGNEKESTSDPDKVDSNSYLAPVFFRREVLSKYYAEPERYSVGDGSISCLDLWFCKIDNDIDGLVVVFLGDLGRDLPYEERLHWRQFNVPPEGTISNTSLKRNFFAQWTSAGAPDLVFRQEYTRFRKDWHKKFGWDLFLPLSDGDAYILETIRIPTNNTQSEQDILVGQLAKLLVDSINEGKLAELVGPFEIGTKGISKLEAYFNSTHFPKTDSVITHLRNLQELRSTGSAHRKGSGFERTKVKLGLATMSYVDLVKHLLSIGFSLIVGLREFYLIGGGSNFPMKAEA